MRQELRALDATKKVTIRKTVRHADAIEFASQLLFGDMAQLRPTPSRQFGSRSRTIKGPRL
jgi:hypothetical protein